jgi:L-alanine-DL-glutamate epimerase-like enolase superfamily enzyme
MAAAGRGLNGAGAAALAGRRAGIAPGRRRIARVDVLSVAATEDLAEGEAADGEAAAEGRTVAEGEAADFVSVFADDGTEGLFGPVDRTTALFVLQALAPALAGANVAAPVELRARMRRAHRHSASGLAVVAASAVECALWDLRGRLAGAPVFELLGGPTRTSVALYASLLAHDATAATTPPAAARALAEGFAGVKLALRHGPREGVAGAGANVDAARRLRAALGGDAALMFDALGGWTPRYAAAWCEAVEDLGLAWLEEPLSPTDLCGLAALSSATPVPIAAGEHAYTLDEARALLSIAAVDVLQSDIAWCGLSEGLRIASACAERNVPLCPHGAGLAVAVQLAAAVEASVVPQLEYHVTLEPRRQRWFAEPLTPLAGRLALPREPGLALRLRPELRRRARRASTPGELCAGDVGGPESSATRDAPRRASGPPGGLGGGR